MDTDRLMSFLSQEGFRPALDERGAVRFNYEGGRYLIRQAPGDEQYVAIAYPNFWQLRTPEETQRALRAANNAGQWTKVAKVLVIESQATVWAEAELLVTSPEQFETVLLRSLAIIKAGVAKFVELMEKSAPLTDARIALGHEDVTRWTHGN